MPYTVFDQSRRKITLAILVSICLDPGHSPGILFELARPSR